MKSKILVLFFLFAALSLVAQQTETKITGQVISEGDENPLPGATISIKGQSGAFTTDKDGLFSIAIKGTSAVITVTHIGYQKRTLQAVVGTPITIVMQKAEGEMDEVVVSTGFEQLPKERATGSFTQIRTKQLNEQVGTDVIRRLGTITNGVVTHSQRNPGTSWGMGFDIRGISSMTTQILRPLVVLDNFEYHGEINNINPNDIESVTFLKDAAAGSIWGAKAANGVIVITTKKAKANQKQNLDFTSNITIGAKPDLFYLKQISTTDKIDVEEFLYDKRYYDFYFDLPMYGPAPEVAHIRRSMEKGQISEQEGRSQIDALRNLDVRNEYENYFYRNYVNQQYALSLKGSSGTSSWLIAGGYDRNLTEVSGRYNRKNARFDLHIRPLRKLGLNISTYYTESMQLSGKPYYGTINTISGAISPYTRFADENGNPLPLYNKYNKGYIDTLGNGLLLDWLYYPLEDYKHVKDQTRIQDLNMVFGLNYRFTKSLQLDLKYRYEQQMSVSNLYQDVESFYARDLINRFSQINYTNRTVKNIIPVGGILDRTSAGLLAQNFRGQLSYHPSWKKHSLASILGTEISEKETDSHQFTSYGYNENVLTQVPVDFTSIYPNLVTGGYEYIPRTFSFGKTNNRFVSFFGNASYTYDQRYTLSISARRDASNIFGLKTNDKWKPLWSVGGAWQISKEDFYKLDWLPMLRLRMTYGLQGNLDPSKTAVITLQTNGINLYTGTPYGQVKTYPNPELTWEQTAMWNIGVDFNLLKRISGSIEYYRKNITDLYGERQVDPTAGIGRAIVANMGSMKGSGLDIHLNSINIDRRLVWTTDLIFNTNKNEIIRYRETPLLANAIAGAGVLGIPGYPAFGYFAFPWAGLDPNTGAPRGYVKGAVSTDYAKILNESSVSDLKYIGTLSPKCFGSLGNKFRYRNISLSFRFVYKFGHWFRKESINYDPLVRQGRGHSDFAKRWQQPGDEQFTNVPSFRYPVDTRSESFYNLSEVLAERADHIRFQYLNLGYNVEAGKGRLKTFRSFELYAVLNDIGIVWRANKAGIDPDYTGLVRPRNFSFGAKIGF
jgi:TonB-linked SusC/RagA family outer membrane protein